jgi:hypothetical protein
MALISLLQAKHLILSVESRIVECSCTVKREEGSVPIFEESAAALSRHESERVDRSPQLHLVLTTSQD